MCKSLPHDGVAQNPWCSHCLAVGVAFLLWLAPSLNSIQKYAGHAGLLVLPLVALSAMVALTATARRHGPGLPKSWLVALCAAPLALFIVLYPMADSGLLGPGSDRDDALNVALQTLLVGHYPYGATTYLGNPPTPMPGALILALPFSFLETVRCRISYGFLFSLGGVSTILKVRQWHSRAWRFSSSDAPPRSRISSLAVITFSTRFTSRFQWIPSFGRNAAANPGIGTLHRCS